MKYLEEIDISSAKERFMGNEALYKKFLLQLPDKNMMAELGGHLEAGNVEEAFKTAHTMKGVVGNLSLNKLYQAVCEVVEVLRAGDMPSGDKIADLKTAYTEAMEAIAEVKDQEPTLFA